MTTLALDCIKGYHGTQHLLSRLSHLNALKFLVYHFCIASIVVALFLFLFFLPSFFFFFLCEEKLKSPASFLRLLTLISILGEAEKKIYPLN